MNTLCDNMAVYSRPKQLLAESEKCTPSRFNPSLMLLRRHGTPIFSLRRPSLSHQAYEVEVLLAALVRSFLSFCKRETWNTARSWRLLKALERPLLLCVVTLCRRHHWDMTMFVALGLRSCCRASEFLPTRRKGVIPAIPGVTTGDSLFLAAEEVDCFTQRGVFDESVLADCV